MSKIKQSIIKEIARQIAIGNTCYLNRKSKNLTIINHSIEDPQQLATQAQTLTDVEQKIENYIKITELTAEMQMRIRKDFVEEILDKSVRKQLSNALNRKNPVRNFNQMVESDMELHLHWKNFKEEEYQRRVSNFIIDAYNYGV